MVPLVVWLFVSRSVGGRLMRGNWLKGNNYIAIDSHNSHDHPERCRKETDLFIYGSDLFVTLPKWCSKHLTSGNNELETGKKAQI